MIYSESKENTGFVINGIGKIESSIWKIDDITQLVNYFIYSIINYDSTYSR